MSVNPLLVTMTMTVDEQSRIDTLLRSISNQFGVVVLRVDVGPVEFEEVGDASAGDGLA